ncbi:cytochrome c oxidase subunit II [Nocardioides sp. KIGAM211]|uniref:cytochrome-c oxidase n=1 Tax=Nocardioides luti TaxID=2761101 RepID=A0A7X0VAT1_9ACTN|nr:cytochrome c oxidase subunit II [Nocardioides luti]
MGLQLPKRSAGTLRRVALLAALGTVLVLLAGCSAQTQHEWKNLAMPDPVTEQGHHTFLLWRYAWIAAMVTGVIVWALIAWVVVAYRRKSDDEVPIQTRYNLPLEIFYTVAPIMMVIVFFYWTVDVQNAVLDEDAPIDNTIEVVGQQWSWTFNYGVGERDDAADEDASDTKYPYDKYVYEAGTGSYVPTLVLPVDETTRFNLHSPDVIHDFGVPAFLMKMDVIPGRVNHYQVTPTEIGEYVGKCYELCGVYHSRMLFKVKVVSQDDYAQYLADREDAGMVSELPLLGGSQASTQAGLSDTTDGGAE